MQITWIKKSYLKLYITLQMIIISELKLYSGLQKQKKNTSTLNNSTSVSSVMTSPTLVKVQIFHPSETECPCACG